MRDPHALPNIFSTSVMLLFTDLLDHAIGYSCSMSFCASLVVFCLSVFSYVPFWSHVAYFFTLPVIFVIHISFSLLLARSEFLACSFGL